MNKKKKNTPIRLNRSELSVPGSRPEFFEKAAQGDSDIVFLDLEDSVVLEKKNQMRLEKSIDIICSQEWGDQTGVVTS